MTNEVLPKTSALVSNIRWFLIPLSMFLSKHQQPIFKAGLASFIYHISEFEYCPNTLSLMMRINDFFYIKYWKGRDFNKNFEKKGLGLGFRVRVYDAGTDMKRLTFLNNVLYNKSAISDPVQSPLTIRNFFYLVYGWYLKNGTFDSLANYTITKKTQKHLGKSIFDWNLWYVGRWRQKK